MLGIKLMLLGIALLIVASTIGDAWIIVFLALGMISVIAGFFVKEKKNTK